MVEDYLEPNDMLEARGTSAIAAAEMLAAQDLAYNPFRYRTWDRLASMPLSSLSHSAIPHLMSFHQILRHGVSWSD